MSIYKLSFLGLILLAGVGCSSDVFLVHNGNMPSADKVAQIKTGLTTDEVQSILGTPSAVTSFDENTWIYMSSTLKKVAFFKPEEIERDVLTITFNDKGRVAEIKNYNEQSGTDVTVDTNATPTEGHDIGFFRKYFGGVGTYMPVSVRNGNDGM